MLLIDNETVAKVLKMSLCMEALEEGYGEYYAGDATSRPRIDVWAPCDVPDAYFVWGSMEGTSKKWRVFALRVKSDITYFPKLAEGVWTKEYYCQRPGRFCGLISLFSLKNGEPLAIIHDGVLQHMRSGARAGLLGKRLALPNASTVGMLGSGGMARVHAMAFKEVRNIQRIKVYSPTKENRESYAKEISELLSIEVLPVDRPEDAVRGAEIVSCCTDSIVPVLKGEWLEEGMFITTVKGAMELDDAAMARIDASVGSQPDRSREGVKEPLSGPQSHSGNFKAYVAGRPEEIAKIPLAHRAKLPSGIRWISFRGPMENKVEGRLSGREIIATGISGGEAASMQGIAFASVGGFTFHLVQERGLGREIPTEWFLQDIRN